MSVDLAKLEAVSIKIEPDGIARIVLCRPAAANARNQQMRDELRAVYASIREDPEVRVVILTGAGERFFSAGMDLKEVAAPETALMRRERLRGSRDIDMLAALPQPTIAAINGMALGGGCEMALACDIRVMADEAVIGLTELDHGLVPGGGGTQRLPRLIGTARTLEMLYLGQRLNGPDAAAIGLVNTSVPRTQLDGVVQGMAEKIATRSPVAVRYAKDLVRRSLELPMAAGCDLELDALLSLMQ